MQKSKGMKIAALLCGAVVAITGIVLVVSHFIKGVDSYRSILIYQLEGSADIEREGSGNIRAAEDLYLESGDRLTVADGSSVRLKLDDDKYIMAEENSVLSIEATGDEADSKTRIQLEQGVITNEIQNPLSTDSEYEVNSPNSVMAVRGTIFRVEIEPEPGEDDETSTRVSVFSGKVSMGALLADGSIGDEILIGAGEEAYCDGDIISGSVMTDPAEIDYQSLSLQTLDLLLELAERNAPLEGISKEELSAFVKEAKDLENAADADDTDNEEAVDETADADDEDSAEDETDTDDKDNNNNNNNGSSSSQNNTGKTTNSGSNSGTNPGSNPGNKPGTNPGTNPGSKPGTNPGTTNPGSKPGTNPEKNPGNKPQKDPEEQQKEYTVTFMYNGEVFATQTVKSGECAEEPKLKPATSGKWDYDFSKKIKKDTTIKWK